MLKKIFSIWEKAKSAGEVQFEKEPIKNKVGQYRGAKILILYAPWRNNRSNSNAKS